jgi:hypothetical protein
LDYYKDRRKWIIEIGPEHVSPQPLGWKLPKTPGMPASGGQSSQTPPLR